MQLPRALATNRMISGPCALPSAVGLRRLRWLVTEGESLQRDPVGENGLATLGGAVEPERAGRYRRRGEVAHLVHRHSAHAAIGPPDLRDARPGWDELPVQRV